MHIFTYHIFFTKGIGKSVRLYEKKWTIQHVLLNNLGDSRGGPLGNALSTYL